MTKEDVIAKYGKDLGALYDEAFKLGMIAKKSDFENLLQVTYEQGFEDGMEYCEKE